MQMTEGSIDSVCAPHAHAVVTTEKLVEVNGAQIRTSIRVPRRIDEMDLERAASAARVSGMKAEASTARLQRGPVAKGNGGCTIRCEMSQRCNTAIRSIDSG